jgi:hypothetical protein
MILSDASTIKKSIFTLEYDSLICTAYKMFLDKPVVGHGAKILAICSDETSVAKWVKTNQAGIVVKPTVDAVVEIFFKIENSKIDTAFIDLDRKELKKNLHIDRFVKNIKCKILPFL